MNVNLLNYIFMEGPKLSLIIGPLTNEHLSEKQISELSEVKCQKR